MGFTREMYKLFNSRFPHYIVFFTLGFMVCDMWNKVSVNNSKKCNCSSTPVKTRPELSTTRLIEKQLPLKKKVLSRDCIETKTDPQFNICLYPVGEDIFISEGIRLNGFWNYDLSRYIHTALEHYPEADFVDIGANIGYFSLYACAHGNNVVAIEAFRRNSAFIHKGLNNNYCKGKVVVLSNAISDTRSILHMKENTGKDMGGIEVNRDPNIDDGAPHAVEAITFDDVLPYLTNKEIVVKIDIEGYECKAMGSVDDFFREKTVYYIFMEWQIVRQRFNDSDTACTAETAQKMVNRLFSYGFVPIERAPNNQQLDIKQVLEWTADDIIWTRSGSPVLSI